MPLSHIIHMHATHSHRIYKIHKYTGKMGVRWQKDLSPLAKRSVLNAVHAVATNKRSDAQQVAGALFGLGLMDCTWETFGVEVRFRGTSLSDQGEICDFICIHFPVFLFCCVRNS